MLCSLSECMHRYITVRFHGQMDDKIQPRRYIIETAARDRADHALTRTRAARLGLNGAHGRPETRRCRCSLR